MKSKTHLLKYSIIFSALLTSSAALANEAGDILVRARLINIAPDASSNISPALDVEDNYSLDISFTYMMSSQFAVELLLDTSSTHRVTLGGTDIVEARVLPPSLMAQYYFNPTSKIRPYIGAGINYTLFLNEETRGPISGMSVKLDDSIGYVVQAGVDYDINNDWFVNLDIKYIDMDTDVNIGGGAVTGNVEINPTIVGIGFGTRF